MSSGVLPSRSNVLADAHDAEDEDICIQDERFVSYPLGSLSTSACRPMAIHMCSSAAADMLEPNEMFSATVAEKMTGSCDRYLRPIYIYINGQSTNKKRAGSTARHFRF